jgi:hypothetical protein
MAPRADFNVDQIRDAGRKDLLYLIEGVSKAPSPPLTLSSSPTLELANGFFPSFSLIAGPWKEERRLR